MKKRGNFFRNPFTIALTVLILFVFLIIVTLIFKPSAQEEIFEEEIIEEECEFCNDVIQTNVIGLNGNIEECNSLSSPASIEFCKTSIIMSQAMSKKDLTICAQLSDEKINNCKDNVLLNKALDEQDKNLCNDILNENTKNLCLSPI